MYPFPRLQDYASQLMTLRTQALTAAVWLSVGSAISQGISYGSTLLLAGLLSPQEMGKAAIGALIVASAGLLREMGIGRALIYQQEPVDDAANTGLILIPVISAALYILVATFAGVAATFFRDADVTLLIRIMALTLVLNAFGEIPSSLMEKRFQFDRKTLADIVGQASYGLLVVLFAWQGYSFWSIAYASVIAAVLNTLALWILAPWQPRFSFDPSLARELLRYGRRIVESGIANFGIRNIDNALVGRMLGPAALGAYDLAYRIGNIPATTVTSILGKIMFPVYSRLSGQPFDLRNAFLKSLKLVGMLTIPISLEIVLVAPDAVTYVYHEKWAVAIVPIQVLTLYGLVRSLSSGQGGIFMALNQVRTMTMISTAQFALLAGLLYPAIHYYGLVGVCWVSVIAMTFSAITHYTRMRPLIGLRHNQVLQALWLSVAASVMAGSVAWLVVRQLGLSDKLNLLVLQSILMGALYVPLLLLDTDFRQFANAAIARFRKPTTT